MLWTRIGYIGLFSVASVFSQGFSAEELLKATRSPDTEVRSSAVSKLSTLSPTPQVLDALATALADPEERVRRSAADTIASLQSDAITLAPAVVALLDDESASVRATAAHTLGRIQAGGDDAIAGFSPLVADQDAVVRSWVATALPSIGGDVKVRIQLLEVLIHDAEPNVRSVAFSSLSKLLPLDEGVMLLAGALDDDHAQVRQSAAASLGNLGALAAAATPRLLESIDDIDWGVKMQAIDALDRIGPESALDAIPKLGNLAADNNANLLTRMAAVRLLGDLGEPAKSVSAQLRQALDANHPALRDSAQRALAALGLEAPSETPFQRGRLIWSGERSSGAARPPQPGEIDQLIQELTDTDLSQRQRAAQTLSAIGFAAEKAVPALAQALRGEHGLPSAAAAALVSIGRPSETALIEALKDPVKDIRMLAARSLGRIGDRASVDAATALAKASRSDVIDVRIEAIEALGRLHGSPKIVAPALIEALKDARLRIGAVRAISQQTEEAAAAVPALIALLNNPNPELLKETLRALTNVRSNLETAVPQLAALLASPDEEIRGGALMVLSSAGPAAAPIRSALTNALDDPIPANRAHAVHALVRTYTLGQPDSEDHSVAAIIPRLISLLQDDTWMVRSAAIQSLGRIGGDALSAWAPVENTLDDPSRNMRYLAVGVLMRLAEASGEPERAVAPLIRALSDRDEGVRITSASSLGQVGAAASAAVSALSDKLSDPSLRVREAARKALQSIVPSQP